MDNEKKYDDALAKARVLYERLCSESLKDDLASIFPELRESEDERMMREFNDWLCEEIEWRTNDLRDEKDRKTLNMLCYVLKKFKDWLEKQKGQNHDGKKWIYEDEYHKDMERCFNDGKDEVLENPGKYGLQKEQKPAEWSKEDKDNLDNIIWLCENCEKGIENVWIPSQATQIKNLIKSLRPSWKPSEEQMNVFKYTLERLRIAGGTGTWYAILESLYEQLKKL